MKTWKRKHGYVRKGKVVRPHRQRYRKAANLRTYYHGTDRQNIPSIMTTGLLPNKPLWNETALRREAKLLHNAEKELKRLIKRKSVGKHDKYIDSEIEGYKTHIASMKKYISERSNPAISLTESPEIASRFTGESKLFNEDGTMKSNQRKGENVILKVTADDSNLIKIPNGWGLKEVVSLEPIHAKQIKVLSDKDKTHTILKYLVKQNKDESMYNDNLPELFNYIK